MTGLGSSHVSSASASLWSSGWTGRALSSMTPVSPSYRPVVSLLNTILLIVSGFDVPWRCPASARLRNSRIDWWGWSCEHWIHKARKWFCSRNAAQRYEPWGISARVETHHVAKSNKDEGTYLAKAISNFCSTPAEGTAILADSHVCLIEMWLQKACDGRWRCGDVKLLINAGLCCCRRSGRVLMFCCDGAVRIGGELSQSGSSAVLWCAVGVGVARARTD